MPRIDAEGHVAAKHLSIITAKTSAMSKIHSRGDPYLQSMSLSTERINLIDHNVIQRTDIIISIAQPFHIPPRMRA